MPTPRPLIIGPTTGPEPSYPLQMEGEVIRGFGRGSKELGIPTANFPIDEEKTQWITHIKSGVYFGWVSLRFPASSEGFTVYPMVVSIGFNPQYENNVRSAEVHVLHGFGEDFYGAEMRVLILGFIREERKYPDLDALIEDIMVDCDVARRSLDREAWGLKEMGRGELDGSWLVRAH